MVHIHNCHTHIFTIKHIPDGFLPLRLVRFLAKQKNSEWFARKLNNLNPFSNKDFFSRYAAFIKQGTDVDQEYILKALMDFYPEDTKFVILTMDLDYMHAGIAAKNYIQQLDEIVKLLPRYGDIIYPFVFAHPRRENILDLVKEYIDKGFKGIKIYPPLGYFPTDPKLFPVYEYAIENNLPIMTHCSRGGVYTREQRKLLPKVHPITGEKLKGKNRKEYTDNFTNPDNFEFLLSEYNDLKICFGHFGGMDEIGLFQDSVERIIWENSWFSKIKKLITKYPNIYADVSYSLSNLSLVPLINVTLLSPKYKDRILFGSDFFMANIEGNEYRFTVYLRDALGEDNFKLIAEINPGSYLNSSLT